jgi:hypothetical protein
MCINLWGAIAGVGIVITITVVVGGLLSWLTTSNHGEYND